MVNEAATDPERTDVMVTAVISKTYFSSSPAEQANNRQQIWPYGASTAFFYFDVFYQCVDLGCAVLITPYGLHSNSLIFDSEREEYVHPN